MQIFPASSRAIEAVAATSANSASASGVGVFGGLLEQASNTTNQIRGSARSMQAILLSGNEAKAAMLRERLSGASKQDAAGMRDGVIDPQAFSEIKGSLSKYGVDDSTMEELQAAVSAGTLTWNGLMANLSGTATFSGNEAQALVLDEATRTKTDLLLQKLGFTTQESEETLKDMEAGKLSKAWDAIQKKIAAIPDGEAVSISADEASALGKAMRLNGDAATRMQKLFGSSTELTADAQQLRQILSEVANQVATQKESAKKRLAALTDAVTPSMEEAWERANRLTAADARTSKDSEASHILIKDSTTAEANGFSTGKTSQQDAAGDQEQKDGLSARDAALSRHTLQDDKNGGKKDSDSAFAGSKESRDGRGKADASATASATPRQAVTTEVTPQPTGAGVTVPLFTTSAEITNQTPHTAQRAANQRVLEQVENGMLRTMQNGARQLTMQLTPEDLGKITVILSVRNNEVNAVIRPESAEAAKAINDQLHQLRLSLENQGLKVENIEVQTGLQNNTNNNWQGFAEHNAQQELNRQFLNQRRMNGLRSSENQLAQEMQTSAGQERISTHSGLDIIA